MGSRSLLSELSLRCRCGRRVYPQPVEWGICLYCESYYELDQVLKQLARHTVFDSVPPTVRRQVIEQLTVDALGEFNRAVLMHILTRPISPFRAFTYFWNGLPGNISQREDILDRIVSFLHQDRDVLGHYGVHFAS